MDVEFLKNQFEDAYDGVVVKTRKYLLVFSFIILEIKINYFSVST